MPPDRDHRESSIQSQGSPNSTAGGDEHMSKRACTECSRLKRKCDRSIPCGLCIKLGKQCVQPTKRRRTKEYVDQLENRLSELHQQLELSSDQDQDLSIAPRPRKRSSVTLPVTALSPEEEPTITSMSGSGGGPGPSTMMNSSRNYINESNERNRDSLNIVSPSSVGGLSSSNLDIMDSFPPPPISMPNPNTTTFDFEPPPPLPPHQHHSHHHHHHHHQQQPSINAPSTSTSIPIDTSPAALSTHSITQSSLPPPSRGRGLAVPSNTSHASTGRSNQNPSTSEVLERQPTTARGYEWNERIAHLTTKGNDGYASLSIKPDGQGYLGFASGSTLLRILQICAGSIPLTGIDTEASSQMEPSRPPQWAPTMMEINTYLDAYFELYHPQYPIFHEPIFRAQWNEIIPQPKQKEWEFLCNIVLSIGAFCSYRPMYVVDHFLELAVSLISADFLEVGSLTLVQAFCLLSNLSQKRNKPNSSSVYMGIAIRLAIGLGLHRELPFWNISPFEREIRRRLWCACIAFDAGTAITFGRPVLQPSYPAESDVRMVHNVHDKSFTTSAAHAPIEVSEPTIYSSLIWHAQFHINTNHIYAQIMSAPAPTAIECLEMDYQLEEWSKQIPDYLRPNPNSDILSPNGSSHWLRFGQYKMLWRYCNLRILLHRRMFLERALRGLPLWEEDNLHPPNQNTNTNTNAGGSSGNGSLEAEMDCCRRCQNSAAETINSINEFFVTRTGKENRLERWYGLHFLFQASFIPLIALHTDRFSTRRLEWEEQVNQARSILNSLKDDPLAERCLKIVNLLIPSNVDPSASSSSSHPHHHHHHHHNYLQGSSHHHTLSSTSNENPQDPFAGANSWLDDIFQSNPNLDLSTTATDYSTNSDWAQNLMPFADLGTLSNIWPGSNANGNLGGFGQKYS